MGESIPFGDLIVLGAIALFIILRYRSVLGQKTGHDFSKTQTDKDGLKLVTPEKKPAESQEAEPEEETLPEFEDAQITNALHKMKATDPAFSVSEFLNGAKSAFEMVIDAFNQHDRETLKMLLSPEVYESFEESMKEQEEKSHTTETTLISLKEAEIVGAEMKKAAAQITVQFLSEQVHVVRDEEKNVIEGDPSRVQDIADEWTFERDLKSRNPNWAIIAT